jgi:hypothetical protein
LFGNTDATFTLGSSATPNSVDVFGQPLFLNVAGSGLALPLVLQTVKRNERAIRGARSCREVGRLTGVAGLEEFLG